MVLFSPRDMAKEGSTAYASAQCWPRELSLGANVEYVSLAPHQKRYHQLISQLPMYPRISKLLYLLPLQATPVRNDKDYLGPSAKDSHAR